MNEPYYSFSAYLKKRFPNQKIAKIPLDAGFSCPNKDGRISQAGCIFCDRYGSGPSVRLRGMSISEQIELFRQTHKGKNYIAYFQAHTNTAGPLSELREKYETIFKFPDIIGLFIGTRPDCIAEDVYDLLGEFNQRTYLSVELGLQSIHSRSLLFLNRNHTYAQFLDTFLKLKKIQIPVIVHLIVGIPEESRQDMLATVREMNRLRPAGVKFHLFHVLKGTPLYQRHLQTPYPLLRLDEYVELLVLLLEHLDPSIVIHRLTAEREREIFIAPQWALNKLAVLHAIKQRMRDSHSFQGMKASS